MFAKVILTAALASSVAVAAPIVERGAGKQPPKGWATGYLEDYETYHLRYLALNCQDQHDTTFFDDCCHPLLATETLAANRPAYCAPNATASSSAAAYTATAVANSTADVDAESQFCNATSSAVSAYEAGEVTGSATEVHTAEATTTSAIGDAKWAPKPTTTSTSEWVAPTTTSSTQEAAQTTQASSGGSVSGDVKTGGYATYFYQNGNAGACGTVHSDNDKVIAIDSNGYWGNDFGSGSSYCGKWINIKNTNNGKTVTAMVADVCPTCNNGNSLDLSVGAFNAIASESDGMVPIEWSFA